MATLSVKDTQDLARSIVASKPGGIRYAALVKEIRQRHPEMTKGAVQGAVFDLQRKFPKEISKPSRGLFIAAKLENGVAGNGSTGKAKLTGIKESDFYEPFAEYLKNELDDVTAAVSLGGHVKKTMWGTPDVVGVYRSLMGDIIQFPSEIVTAEIKISPLAPIVAFGQAVAYRLFSAKTYIVMPVDLTPANLEKLESLCMLFGVGLVLFKLDKEAPDFQIRMRAQRFSPDVFYVNDFATQLKQHNPKVFNKLFN